MRKILLFLSVSLTGCAERSVTFLPAKPPAEKPGAFATLSSSDNRADMTASKVYTRLELLRYRIENALSQGYIGTVHAESYRHQADGIQHAVDRARADKRLMTIESQSRQLDVVIDRLEADIAAAKAQNP